MVKRRKFVIGLGALVAGSGAALGTGAYTSASLERDSNIDIVSDSSGVLALKDELPSDIVHTDGSGQLHIDFGMGSGKGVAPGSVYNLDPAFSITNYDSVSHDVTLTYDLDDYSGGSPAWANIFFTVTDGEGNSYSFGAKEQNSGDANTVTIPDVGSGETLLVTMRVDVKDDASTSDNLNGTIEVSAN
jgi:hypothetical protein